MPISERENYIRNATFQHPEYMPLGILVSDACRIQWREELEAVMVRHPRVWPGFEKGKVDYDNYPLAPGSRQGEEHRDTWGCLWWTPMDGIASVVKESPLEDWSAWEAWEAPNPMTTGDSGPVDWDAIRKNVAAQKEQGGLTTGMLPHGFFFMRLTYLRGFEGAMMDMCTDEPLFHELIDVLYNFNRVAAEQYLSMGVDTLVGGEDLGTQQASIIGPILFKKYIKPTYEKLFKPYRERGLQVALHSDGYLMDIMDDIIESGVSIINPQDLCNGVENLRREVKGRVCIALDVDRQTIVPFGTPKEIDELVEEEVRLLGAPEGGLSLVAGVYPPTSLENLDALATAFEKYQTYWFDGRGKA